MSEKELWKCLDCGEVITSRDAHAAGHPGGIPSFDQMPLPETDGPEGPTA